MSANLRSVPTGASESLGRALYAVAVDPCHIEVHPHRTRVEVCVSGELDAATVGAFDARLSALLEDGWRHVVVDFSGVSFMDSTGVRALLDADRAARSRAARLELRLGRSPARRILELTGLLDVLECDAAGRRPARPRSQWDQAEAAAAGGPS